MGWLEALAAEEATRLVQSIYVEPIKEAAIETNMAPSGAVKETPQREIVRKKHFSEVE